VREEQAPSDEEPSGEVIVGLAGQDGEGRHVAEREGETHAGGDQVGEGGEEVEKVEEGERGEGGGQRDAEGEEERRREGTQHHRAVAQQHGQLDRKGAG